jgi:N-acetylglutamate synthase-like GNAT family acetyltransferase
VSQSHPSIVGLSIAEWERDGLIAALSRANLPVEDVKRPGPLFWRFENSDVPVGFGGLEIYGDHALLRSIITLPPVRKRGVGRAIVATLELEASIRGCRTAWLLAPAADFFLRLGYRQCERGDLPRAIQETAQFTRLCPTSAVAMTKRLE